MARGDTRARTGLSPFLLASTALVWVSAVIVMGILAYLVSRGWGGDHVIYELVISVLTTAFYLLAFFLGTYPGYVLLFNLIFSYLWLVVVSFTASDWTYSNSALLHAAEAFSFIAFFFLFFNVLYDWHYGFYRPGRTRAVV
ncbi:MARVEL domain-containing protein [Madurella fahalii]|uniref:MARVEL domain-containing protein n=1 Tax=Madurella fahalii TaxID=1157608 RepID=A0ABQ0GPX8_9PEZI